MKFFVPMAESEKEAGEAYQGFAKFVNAPISDKKIWKLRWRHDKENMECEVGKSIPANCQTGNEPVLAIFDCGNLYKICTPNRGGIRGEPILAGKNHDSFATYFD
ncbi:MAG: hypothetical protein FVQ80_00005 [Planctomycetes bacterium]|nr:hypothetical protein [Planctomycetota bacterium]